MGHPIGMVNLERARKLGRKFLAPVETHVGGLRTMVKVLPELVRGRKDRTPQVAPGPFRTGSSVYAMPSESGLRVTWFGHSSMLWEIDGTRILMDPVWDERAAPVQWFGPKRFFAPTLPLDELPPLDAVLISHDHYDHLGKGTVQTLAGLRPDLRWITSLGVGAELRDFGVAADRITELDWTESATVGGLTITSLPARHFSGRSLSNRNETLWASFALRGPRHNLYYGADSGLWDGFRSIGEQFGPFDVTMLEIGAFNEAWKDIHLGPDGAAEAFTMLGGGLLMPIHWGLFDLALHGWLEPIERILQLADSHGISLFSPEPGKPAEPCVEVSRWWRREDGTVKGY
jgi:L-ascorbate metabolism protein UlaG (beta-lactamase superfamily)